MLPGLSDPPRLQGRFRIESELARGGMGSVHAAFDESTGQRVALKRLTPGAPPRIATLFEREFYVLSALKHPSIIEVYDYGIDADGPYYTMELLEGSDMRELSPMPVAKACRYLRDVASSLALLHARRLLHRDVSPRNVRALGDGRCKLIDFGALASFGASEELVGTPPAIPPEALSGQALDCRSDLYSLGALAYFMLTGRHAYPARTVSALPDTWSIPPSAPSRYAPDVSPELDRLVLSLLSMNVLARPSSAAEVIEQLQVLGGLDAEQEQHAAQAYFAFATLVERERELERAQRRLQRARDAQGGGGVFISAEPGMGKTRFLSEVAVLAQLAGVTALRVDAASHSSPLSTARALVQQLFRVLPKTAAKVFRPHAAALRVSWPDLRELDDAPAQPESPMSIPPAGTLPAFLETCICSVARKHPLLIAVDNVEHADAQSAALLLLLSRAARRERLLIVSTASTQANAELPKPIHALREAASGIHLRPLTPHGVTALVKTAFGDVPQVLRTAKRLFAATRGSPERCMRVLQHWVDTGVVQYVGGAWTLPIELSADVLRHTQDLLEDRLKHCSEPAQQIARSLAVLERPGTLETCVLLEPASAARRELVAALEELVQAEVLSLTAVGYRFVHESLRASLLQRMDATRLSTLQVRVAEAVLAAPDIAVETQLHAGLLLIRGGQELRGAEVIRGLARAALTSPTDPGPLLAGASKALEAALDVARRAGLSRSTQLGLQVPLVLAGFYISPTFSQRYAFDTIASLQHVLGLSQALAASATLDAGALLAILGRAPVLDPDEVATPETPDVVTLVGWLIRSVMSVIGTAAAAIDHETQERAAKALQPFKLFGPEHPASVAHDYCRLVTSMTEGHPAASHAGWTELLSRLPALAVAPAVKARLRLGALFSLGVLECQRDDDVALERMQEIEREPSVLSVAYADQLRFLYFGFRGDIEQAQRYRDRVEAYAVQHGSAWQVEIWSTCTLSSVYGNTRDVAGSKQVTDQLERLKRISPSLEQYWERAAATKLAFTGATERAIELYSQTLARSGPNERVGWSSVRGGLARAYNTLKRYEEARRVCEETISLSEADVDYVAVTLTVRVELCLALAGLGEFEAANIRLAHMIDLYTPNKNPVTLGTLHRAGAEIARMNGDKEAFERHLTEMQAWFHPTKNPALVAQCDQLRSAAGQHDTREDPYAGAAFSTLVGDGRSVLAGCEGPQARKLRALELVAAYHEISQAWLFTRDSADEPVLVGKLGADGTPEQLVTTVRALFEESDDEGDETAYVESASEMESTFVQSQSYRLLPLTVDQGTQRWLVGVIAFPADTGHRSANHAFLQDVATQLFEAGDLVTVRMVI